MQKLFTLSLSKIPSSPTFMILGAQVWKTKEWLGLKPEAFLEEWICQEGKGWILVLLQTPISSFSIAELICTGCGNYPCALESL